MNSSIVMSLYATRSVLLVPGMVWLVMMVMVGISPDLYAAAIRLSTSLSILSVVSVPSPE